MNQYHDQYLRNGEIDYIGRVDSVRLLPGDGRFLLRYWITDPRAKILKIYWSQNRESLIVPIPEHTPLDSMEVLVGDMQDRLEEGIHTIQMFTTDDQDLSSVKFEKNVNIYGDQYKSTILQRFLLGNEYNSDDKSVTLNWSEPFSDKEIGLEIEYFDTSSNKIDLKIPTEEVGASTILQNIDVSKGVNYRTAYLPEPLAIDTFYTEGSKVAIKEFINVSEGCETHASGYLGAYEPRFAVDGNRTANASRWVTVATNDVHWLELDLGEEYLISAFETWGGSPAQKQFNLQVEQDGEWINVYSAIDNSDLHFYAEFTPVKARKVRYYIPAYQLNQVRLFEIVIYQINEY